MAETFDLKDDTGIYVLQEMKKVSDTFSKLQPELNSLPDIGTKEWFEIFLYANSNNKSLKTALVKELYILYKRTKNMTKTANWAQGLYGGYDWQMEEILNNLEKENKIKIDKKNGIKIILTDVKEAKLLFDSLPAKFKEVIKAIVEEFDCQPLWKIKKYIYAAYPEFDPSIDK